MTVNSIAQNQLSSAMIKLSSGNRINSAADDAAGLAIMEKIESQVRGLDQGTDNTADMKNLVNTAEGALNTLSEGLQRVRELSLQAANGIYSDSDRAIIQNEVSQIMQGMGDTIRNAEFNKIKLLEGGGSSLHTASYADGSGMTVSIPDMNTLMDNLQAYDVTKAFDIGSLDEVMSAVNSVRAELGAMSNRMDHTINSNSITILNQMAAKSRIADMDMAKGAMDLSKENVLNQVSIFSMKSQMETQKTNTLSLLV